jgi:aminopeptidase
MPDGEVYCSPDEHATEGEIRFGLAQSFGRRFEDVRLRFAGGRVVDASAAAGEDALLELLDTDEGARRLGELAIATNDGITHATGSTLFDEKIGGTFHLAIGASYPESGGVNDSAVHWDMVCDLRNCGSITVDGQEFQRDGKFLV